MRRRRVLPGSIFLPGTTERSLRQAILDMYLLLRQAILDFFTDPPETTLAPDGDVKIHEGTSAVAVRSFEVASGKKLTIESGARFYIV